MAVGPPRRRDLELEEKDSPLVWLKEVILKRFIPLTLLLLTITVPAFAEKLVDPTKVAPEYREAAQKRRAEQLRELECSHKADAQKVMPRDRTAFLLQCIEADAGTK